MSLEHVLLLIMKSGKLLISLIERLLKYALNIAELIVKISPVVTAIYIYQKDQRDSQEKMRDKLYEDLLYQKIPILLNNLEKQGEGVLNDIADALIEALEKSLFYLYTDKEMYEKIKNKITKVDEYALEYVSSNDINLLHACRKEYKDLLILHYGKQEKHLNIVNL